MIFAILLVHTADFVKMSRIIGKDRTKRVLTLPTMTILLSLDLVFSLAEPLLVLGTHRRSALQANTSAIVRLDLSTISLLSVLYTLSISSALSYVNNVVIYNLLSVALLLQEKEVHTTQGREKP